MIQNSEKRPFIIWLSDKGLTNIYYLLMPWKLTGSFKCWLFGHKYKFYGNPAKKEGYCITCQEPCLFIEDLGEPRILERIYTLIKRYLFV